jgi:hypothetical protein
MILSFSDYSWLTSSYSPSSSPLNKKRSLTSSSLLLYCLLWIVVKRGKSDMFRSSSFFMIEGVQFGEKVGDILEILDNSVANSVTSIF